MNVLSDLVEILRWTGCPRTGPATRQTILLQTFYPALTPVKGCSANAIPMNLLPVAFQQSAAIIQNSRQRRSAETPLRQSFQPTAPNRLKAELQTISPSRV